jgi:hypothetical protein
MNEPGHDIRSSSMRGKDWLVQISRVNKMLMVYTFKLYTLSDTERAKLTYYTKTPKAYVHIILFSEASFCFPITYVIPRMAAISFWLQSPHPYRTKLFWHSFLHLRPFDLHICQLEDRLELSLRPIYGLSAFLSYFEQQ